MILRPYQEAAINALYTYWIEGRGSHPLIVAPTGAGKTAILARIVTDAMAAQSRVLILTHVKELIEQGAATLRAMLPSAEIGIYSASLRSKELFAPVVYGQIQSIYKRAFHLFPSPDLIIIDEAHLVPRNDSTRYGKFLSDLRIANPKAKIVGLTATPYRLDSGWLHKGDGAIFDGIAYDISIADLMRDGYLSPVVSKSVKRSIDLTNVRKRGGEFREDDLAIAASDPELVRETVAEIVDLGKDRRSWLIFASGVPHARMLDVEMATHGIRAEVLTGSDPMAERAGKIAAFKRGDLRCLINIGVLTTGFDAPNVDLVALVRATESAALYVQMVGRGTRKAPGKADCLILDYGGNVMRHGVIDAITPKRVGSGGGEAPVKVCPSCEHHLATAVRMCPHCGHQFPPPTLNHVHRAYSGALISTQISPEWLDVKSVTYSRHRKPGKPDSIKATYRCGLLDFNEWLCPDHEGYARLKYIQRIAQLGGKATTTAEAISECNKWRKPKRIRVRQNGKHNEVLTVEYYDAETV